MSMSKTVSITNFMCIKKVPSDPGPCLVLQASGYVNYMPSAPSLRFPEQPDFQNP